MLVWQPKPHILLFVKIGEIVRKNTEHSTSYASVIPSRQLSNRMENTGEEQLNEINGFITMGNFFFTLAVLVAAADKEKVTGNW